MENHQELMYKYPLFLLPVSVSNYHYSGGLLKAQVLNLAAPWGPLVWVGGGGKKQ